MLKRLLRDNQIVNPVVRTLLRFLLNYSKSFLKLTHIYRVYGEVSLAIQGTNFMIYSKADDNIANEIFYDHGYEAEEFKLVKEITASSQTFVDVGANTGIFSVFAAKANPALKVLSFEPHPSNYSRLQRNIEINNLTASIKTFQFALGETETMVQFTIPADDRIATTSSVNEAFATHFHEIPQKQVDVRLVTLDSVLTNENITSVDLIKIDVEYYELEVLKGTIKTLSVVRPLVLVEILDYKALLHRTPKMHGRISESHAEEIEKLLCDLNYHPYAISKNGIYAADTVLSGHDHRNFLFVPVKLPKKEYSVNELRTLFTGLAETSHG